MIIIRRDGRLKCRVWWLVTTVLAFCSYGLFLLVLASEMNEGLDVLSDLCRRTSDFTNVLHQWHSGSSGNRFRLV